MSKQEGLLAEQLKSLEQAQETLQAGLDSVKTQDIDPGALLRFRNFARDSRDQAIALIIGMVGRDVDEDLLSQAQDLADFFEHAEWTLEIRLGLDRGCGQVVTI